VDEGGALVVPGGDDKKAPPEEAKVESTPSAADEELAADPLRRFGGQGLRDVLGPGALVLGGDAKKGTLSADDLEVDLPPSGTTLASPRLFLRGKTNPKNVVTVDGRRLHLTNEGRFAELVTVASDAKALVIESKDPAGNVARLSWPIAVKDTEFFLLAMVDGVGGQVGARLEELTSYDKTDDGSLFIAGRGALYAKARISGTALAKDLFITAHVDSTRRHEFTAFYDQVIDPTRDYVIYGDASDDVRDANARGRFYVMVQADKSKLSYGSFRTDIAGIHLLRYDRTFDGAKLDFDKEVDEGFRTRVKAYVSDDNRRLVRRHDELRATGGSVYYTSSREIMEGSDKIELVVRELDTQMELGRATLTRDIHYRIDYPSGRIMMNGPISSVIDPFFQIAGFQPFTGRAMLDGHEVWLDIDYESRAVNASGDIAYGVHARQELFGRVEIGGGIVREGRPSGGSGGDADYVLWGVQAKVKLSEKSKVYGEFAKATDKDGATRLSLDGGLAYRDLDRAPNDQSGHAFLVGLDADLGDLFEIATLDLQIKAHWQMIEAGYHAVGLASEEGTEKWGGEVTWKPYEDGRVMLRYDGGTTLVADTDFVDGLRAVVRNRWVARYDQRLAKSTVYGELGFGQHRDDLDGKVYDTTAAAVGGILRVGNRVRLMASQEFLIGGQDTLLGFGAFDRMTTNVGVELDVSDDLALRFGQSIRWNGDNATRFGFTTKLGEDARAYFEERVQPGDRNGRVVGSTVIGAEHALGRDLQDGRIYSEYRLDGGVGGRTNRAVMGIGRSLELAPGVRAMIAYERSQVIDAPEADLSRGSRDVLSGGLQIGASDILRYGGLYEVRWDRELPSGPYREVLQAVTRNTLTLKLGEDVTLLGLANYMLSQDLETRRVVREDLEASVGLAIRPLANDDLVFIARYARVLEREAKQVVSLLGETLNLDERRQSDLVSLSAIIELPLGLKLTEKVAWRFSSAGSSGTDGDQDLILWVNRLGWEIWDALELAGEFRLVASILDWQVEKNGGLVELSYDFFEHARLGVGWSIDGNAGGLLPGELENDIKNGFFVRMTGMY
ncbi:MAG: hypothetical protein JNJ59_15705, partial [Deltaproteobacteria bacterium]|nr:hypothetical protein [Deltaproteobacteria bacterium]